LGSERRSARGIIPKLCQDAYEPIDILRLDETTRHTILDDLRHAARAGTDARLRVLHRLEKHDAKPLPHARQGKNITVGVGSLQVRRYENAMERDRIVDT
jgi:hypothetical protein